MTTAIAIHGIVGIVAFGMLVFPGIVCTQVARSGSVPAIRAAFPVAVACGRIAGPLAVLAALFGLWIAHGLGYSLTSGWLVAAYAVFITVIAIGIVVHMRWETRVLALAQASLEETPSPELREEINSTLARLMDPVSFALWVILLYLMIARPF